MTDNSAAAFRARFLSVALDRMRAFGFDGLSFDGNRDMYEALGFARRISLRAYRDRYARGGVAGRCVDIFPKATWRGQVELTEDGDPSAQTELEKAWADLSKRLGLQSIFERADILSGIGSYAVIVIGGGGSLDSELPKVTYNSGAGAKGIKFLKPYLGAGGPLSAASGSALITDNSADAWAEARVLEIETDQSSERYSLPKFYQLMRLDPANPGTPVKVHWTRVIHVAENTLDNELYAAPRLERVWNLLDNLDKVTGGGSEAFWLRANQGTVFNVDKDAALTADEKTALKDQSEEYANKMRRNLLVRKVEVKPLGSDVADFSNPADAILSQIAGTLGVPKRLLIGSEMGELASSQDRENFRDQIIGRQTVWAGPKVVRALADRLIERGYLPPAKSEAGYEVKWPHTQVLTEDEKADGAQKWAATQTAEGPVFGRDEIRDKWYGMAPFAEANPELAADEEAAVLGDASVADYYDPETGQPLPDEDEEAFRGAATNPAFDPQNPEFNKKHPRSKDGKFTYKMGAEEEESAEGVTVFKKPKNKPATPEQIATMWQLYNLKKPYKVIAEQTGLTEKQAATIVFKIKKKQIEVKGELAKALGNTTVAAKTVANTVKSTLNTTASKVAMATGVPEEKISAIWKAYVSSNNGDTLKQIAEKAGYPGMSTTEVASTLSLTWTTDKSTGLWEDLSAAKTAAFLKRVAKGKESVESVASNMGIDLKAIAPKLTAASHDDISALTYSLGAPFKFTESDFASVKNKLMDYLPAAAQPEVDGWPFANDEARYGKDKDKVVNHYLGWTKSNLGTKGHEAIKSYTGSAYGSMNPQLWDLPGASIPASKTKLVGMQNHLLDAPKPPPPQIVWRKLSSDAWNKIAGGAGVGDEVMLKGFQSSSISPNVWSGNIMLEIKPKTGAYVGSFSHHPSELEFIIPHGRRFVIRGFKKVQIKDWVKKSSVIQLEEID